MNKLSRMRLTFIILAIVFIIIAVTGVCMDFYLDLFNRRTMKYFHIYCGYFMILLVIIHLLDNKLWIKNIFNKK